MARCLQIRNVSERLKMTAKAHARSRGQSLNAYLRDVLNLAILGEQPDPSLHREREEAFLQTLHSRPIYESGFDSTAYIRRIRDAGDSA